MKLVKIKINNRVDRILNFDRNEQFHNNSYIIRNSTNGPQELFSISSEPQLIDDEGIKDLTVKITENEDELTVSFELKDGKNKTKELPKGLELKNSDYVCKRKQHTNSDHYKLNFRFGDSTISIFIYYSTHDTTYDAIIDFGSEASQAAWLNLGDLNKVQLTESIRNMHSDSKIKDENELKKFVQWENRYLYKSIYYIKNSFSATPTDAWPNYDGNDWKFLVKNSERVSSDYLQLPNSKLLRFDLADYTELRIKVGNRNQQLKQLKNNIIERTLLNNIVGQVLQEIASNAGDKAYITMNILIPNIYPIHFTAEKMEWLAKDIQDWVNKPITSDENNNAGSDINKIKAVELCAISESDASMIGYINKLPANEKLNSGIYLIMDAGKGTLDFSFMEVCAHGTPPYINRSRAGIVGAGNAVTYGLLVGLINDFLSVFYKGYQEKGEEKTKLIKQYISEEILGSSVDLANLTGLLNAVESYKKVYNNLYKDKSSHPSIQKSDEPKESLSDINVSTLSSWINTLAGKKTYLSEESCNYVTWEIENIVNEAGLKLKEMIECNRTTTGNDSAEKDFTQVEGIIFTGRGFLMQELFDNMEKKLKGLGIMKQDDEVKKLDDENDMKGICIDINQMLLSGKYVFSASRQTIGLHNRIDEKKDKQIPKIGKIKKKIGSDPLRSESWGIGFREAGGEYVKQSGGNILNEGIRISKEDISNSFSISIGGWRYEIDSSFENHDSVLYFDGISYWLTSNGIAPYELQEDAQNRPKCRLGFESLFPNIVLNNDNKDNVIIPSKGTEPSTVNERETLASETDDVTPSESISTETTEDNTGWKEKLSQWLKDFFSIPE